MVKPVHSSVRRAARLMQLGAGLAGSYLAYQLQRPLLGKESATGRRHALRRRQAQRVRRELQELRGPIMKVGQALSSTEHANSFPQRRHD